MILIKEYLIFYLYTYHFLSKSGTLFSKTSKDINIESIKDYEGEDTDITHRLYKVLYPIKEGMLKGSYFDISYLLYEFYFQL